MDGITKDFDLGQGRSVTAVQDISFEIEPNSVCVLLGPSGCGKSTILHYLISMELEKIKLQNLVNLLLILSINM